MQREATRGDLAIVTNDHVTRIVCITDVTDTHLVAVLCSNEVEMATDHDVIVHRPNSYDLLCEAELYLVCLPTQVREIVGSVDLDAIGAVRDSLRSDGASTEALAGERRYSTGMPLGGIDDPRRAFAERELDDVVVLRDPAHQLLFDDGWNPGRR